MPNIDVAVVEFDDHHHWPPEEMNRDLYQLTDQWLAGSGFDVGHASGEMGEATGPFRVNRADRSGSTGTGLGRGAKDDR